MEKRRCIIDILGMKDRTREKIGHSELREEDAEERLVCVRHGGCDIVCNRLCWNDKCQKITSSLCVLVFVFVRIILYRKEMQTIPLPHPHFDWLSLRVNTDVLSFFDKQ